MLPQLGSRAYHLGVRLAAQVGVTKAQKWVAGRATVTADLKDISRRRQPEQKLVWLHAASLGEFEQGAPVLEMIRAEYPDHFLVLSFFSPSGYEARKDYPIVDAVLYLAEDNPTEARNWVAKLNPQLAIFVKYEFWPAHLAALRNAGVPTVLIAGSFREGQPFFKWYGANWRKLLTGFDRLVVQTEADAALLSSINIRTHKVTVAGDPRTDRTIQLAQAPFQDDILQLFSENRSCLLAGSVWPPDVAVLLELLPHLPENWSLIIAPHELTESQLQEWAEAFGAVRYTMIKNGEAKISQQKVLLLDTIGILSRAYRYADLAYVGGAFKTGLHNTLEPMAYELPVIFGPRYHKFPEAVFTLASGGSFSTGNGKELIAIFNKIHSGQGRQSAIDAVRAYTHGAMGATARTFKAIRTYLE